MPIQKSTVDDALAAMTDAVTLDGGVIDFLNALPPDTPLRDAITALTARSADVRTALAANVPPPPVV